MDNSVYVLGIGHNSITFIDLLVDCGYEIKGLYHYNHDAVGCDYFGYKINGCFEDLLASDIEGEMFCLSMGDIAIRKQLFERIKAKGGVFPTLIHPSSVVSPHAKIGEGLSVFSHSIIQGDTIIGDNVVITFNSSVSHSTEIGNHCFISGHCLIGAFVKMEDEIHIGQGSIIVSGTNATVGRNSVLGAGSVLRGTMKPDSIYLGNPARFIKAK